jgi:transcriptional regulator with XRE-family HTH domain
MDKNRSELGKYLEQMRKKLSLSLREASERSGLSHSYIRDLEIGYNHATKAPIKPSTQVIKQLADAYQCSYEELLKKAGYITDIQDHILGDDLKKLIEDPTVGLILDELKDSSEEMRREALAILRFVKQNRENNKN